MINKRTGADIWKFVYLSITYEQSKCSNFTNPTLMTMCPPTTLASSVLYIWNQMKNKNFYIPCTRKTHTDRADYFVQLYVHFTVLETWMKSAMASKYDKHLLQSTLLQTAHALFLNSRVHVLVISRYSINPGCKVKYYNRAMDYLLSKSPWYWS